jgi:ATP-binding protein involved in chromosome partitioning
VAIALQQAGAKVGLLDADIYGPNQPQMLGGIEKPYINENKKFEPIVRFGLQTNSIGYLVPDEKAMIWRGPMVSGALTQLLNDTQWQDLDYLIIDLPPGTGDIQLTLAQKLPVSGAMIVTTPQSVATADAAKAIAMFEKVSIEVLGLVENMAYYQCPNCEDKDYLFGEGGGKQLAKQHSTAFLGELPLQKQIREQADAGEPIIVAQPESQAAKTYKKIALNLAIELALRPKNLMYNLAPPRVEA